MFIGLRRRSDLLYVRVFSPHLPFQLEELCTQIDGVIHTVPLFQGFHQCLDRNELMLVIIISLVPKVPKILAQQHERSVES